MAVYEAYTREFILHRYKNGGVFNGDKMTDADLAGIKLAGVHFKDVEMEKCSLKEADLHGLKSENLTAKQVDLSKASLSGAVLTGSAVTQSYLIKTDFSGSRLISFRMKDCVAHGIVFDKAHIIDGQFIDNEMYKSRFHQCVMVRTLFTSRQMVHMVNLGKALFINSMFIECAFKGINLAEACLDGSVFLGCDFTGMELDDVDSRGARFAGCRLEGSGIESRDVLKPRGPNALDYLGQF